MRLIDVEEVLKTPVRITGKLCGRYPCELIPVSVIENAPTIKAVAEEDVVKFYYCESDDEYLIGMRVDNMYYAKYDGKSWVWCMSRYLPWGEHVVAPETLWKEHTYPSEPKEIFFTAWLEGFLKKYHVEAKPVGAGKWIKSKIRKKMDWRPTMSELRPCPNAISQRSQRKLFLWRAIRQWNKEGRK